MDEATELKKLRWRCRRGLLENDLLIERFFADPAAHEPPPPWLRLGIGDDAARPADPAGADTDSEVRAGR